VRRAALLLVLAGGAAAADVPRGKPLPRPQPTHVVLADSVVELTPSLKAQVAIGTPVVVVSGLGPFPGKVVVRTLGDVELTGKIDGGALGLVVARDVDVTTADGREPLGRAAAGSWVKLAAPKPIGGMLLVDTVGPLKARMRIPADALGGEPRELVVPNAGRQISTGMPADLFSTPEAKGVRAQIAEFTPVWIVDEAPDKPVAKVRTFGGVAIEGWILKTKLAPGVSPNVPPLPSRATPSHEVLTGADLIADPRGGKPVARLRGGALVTIDPDAGKGALLVQVRTRYPVVVVGWVKAAELRPLEPSVWLDP
jgi:hypothetical protein